MVDGVNKNEKFQTLLGVTGSGKTFTIANVIAQTGKPSIVMAPNKTLAAQLYSEFRDFFPQNAVEYFVSYYDYYQPEAYVPGRDVFIEKDSSINDHIEQMRLSATKSLLERDDSIMLQQSLLFMVLEILLIIMEWFFTFKLRENSSKKYYFTLVSMQYDRNDFDFSRGCFRVRGDVIDIFPQKIQKQRLGSLI